MSKNSEQEQKQHKLDDKLDYIIKTLEEIKDGQ